MRKLAGEEVRATTVYTGLRKSAVSRAAEKGNLGTHATIERVVSKGVQSKKVFGYNKSDLFTFEKPEYK